MKLDFHGERLLAVVAHPDDAELYVAGTLARAKEDGADIAVAYLCQGDRGQPPTPIPDLPAARRREAALSAELLGAELFSGIVPDGTLADTDAVRHHLLIIYRTFRPTLVLAHAPADYHPDHRAAAQVAEAGTWFAASKAFTTDGLAPLDTPPALWWMDTLGMTGFEPSLYIDVSPFAQLKEQLLACHVSQLGRTAGGAMHPLRDLMVEQQSVRGREAGTLAAEAFRPHLTHKRTRAW